MMEKTLDMQHEEKEANLASDIEGKALADVLPKRERFWIFYPHLLRLNVLLLAGILAQVTAGYDGSMLNGLQSVAEWQDFFGHPVGARLGTMSNGLTIGTLITTPFVSYMCEYMGRRYTILIGCAVIVIGSILQGASQNFNMFLGARILIGVGGSVASTSASVWLAECAYPDQRPTITSLFQAGFAIGSFVGALVTWGPYNNKALSATSWSRRIPSILQGFLPLVQLVLLLFGPESPRWLISKGKQDRALDFFSKYHGNGDPSSIEVQFQMAEISATIEAEKIQRVSRWAEWFSTRPMVHRFCICFALPMMQQLCGNAIVSYYLPILLKNLGITSSITQLKINLGLTAWGMVCGLVCASLVYRLKRRVQLMTGYSAMCLVFSIFTIISAINLKTNFQSSGLPIGAVAMIFLFQGAYHICSPLAVTYIMEICPFSLRAKGSMIYQLSTSIVGLFNNYVNPIAMGAIAWKYYIVWDIWLVVQVAIVYFFFPETSGKSLEEVAEVFGDSLIDNSATASKLEELNTFREKEDASHVEYV